jgi:phosphatidate cytidylyltransferase
MRAFMYDMIFFIVLAGIGMAIANRKVTVTLNRQRWKKYFTYLLVTGLVLWAIIEGYFHIVSIVIGTLGLVELLRVNIICKDVRQSTRVVSIFIYLYIAVEFIFFACTFQNSLLLFIYFQVLVFDGYCQIMGQLFGKHKLVPMISPSKTVEGLIGGWLFCIIAGILAAQWLDPLALPLERSLFGLCAGMLTGLSAFCGDLLASFYKRKCHVKDFSNWLPGQGGFLDRFDSLLMTGTIYYLAYSIFLRHELDSLLIIRSNE